MYLSWYVLPYTVHTVSVCESIFSLAGLIIKVAAPPPPKRPRLLVSVNARIPTAVRQNFLDSFIDEYLKFLSEEKAYKKVCIANIIPYTMYSFACISNSIVFPILEQYSAFNVCINLLYWESGYVHTCTYIVHVTLSCCVCC